MQRVHCSLSFFNETTSVQTDVRALTARVASLEASTQAPDLAKSRYFEDTNGAANDMFAWAVDVDRLYYSDKPPSKLCGRLSSP